MTCYPSVDAMLFKEQASAPPDASTGVPGLKSGQIAFYYKSDGKWYVRTHQGNEQEFVTGSASTWTSITGFFNGWYNSASYPSAAYRKIDNCIEMRGVLFGGTMPSYVDTLWGGDIFYFTGDYRVSKTTFVGSISAYCKPITFEIQPGGSFICWSTISSPIWISLFCRFSL